MSKDKTDDGGTAFPLVVRHERDEYSAGMSLRDYFAAKAMQAIVTAYHDARDVKAGTVVSTMAYAIADAMLAERKGGKP